MSSPAAEPGSRPTQLSRPPIACCTEAIRRLGAIARPSCQNAVPWKAKRIVQNASRRGGIAAVVAALFQMHPRDMNQSSCQKRQRLAAAALQCHNVKTTLSRAYSLTRMHRAGSQEAMTNASAAATSLRRSNRPS